MYISTPPYTLMASTKRTFAISLMLEMLTLPTVHSPLSYKPLCWLSLTWVLPCITAVPRAVKSHLMYCRLKTLLVIQKTNYIQDTFRFESWTSHDSYVTMMDIKRTVLYKSQTEWMMGGTALYEPDCCPSRYQQWNAVPCKNYFTGGLEAICFALSYMQLYWSYCLTFWPLP